MKYEIQTYTLCDGWVNCWQEDDKPVTFETMQEARDELAQYIKDMREAVRNGDIQYFDHTELKITKI